MQVGLLLIEDAKDELRMSWEELEGEMNKRGKMCFVRLGLGCCRGKPPEAALTVLEAGPKCDESNMIFVNIVGGNAHLRVDDVVPRKHIVQPEARLRIAETKQ